MKQHLADMAQKEEAKLGEKLAKRTGDVVDGSTLPSVPDITGGGPKETKPCTPATPATLPPGQPAPTTPAGTPAPTPQH